MAQDDIRTKLLELATALCTEDPCLFRVPTYPRVRINNLRWSDLRAQGLFDVRGVDDDMLYAEGIIEGTGPRTFQVFLRANPDRPDKFLCFSGWVPTISFGVERNLSVSLLIESLIESALKMGLMLEIGEAADG